jgi:hypothetical protein
MPRTAIWRFSIFFCCWTFLIETPTTSIAMADPIASTTTTTTTTATLSSTQAQTALRLDSLGECLPARIALARDLRLLVVNTIVDGTTKRLFWMGVLSALEDLIGNRDARKTLDILSTAARTAANIAHQQMLTTDAPPPLLSQTSCCKPTITDVARHLADIVHQSTMQKEQPLLTIALLASCLVAAYATGAGADFAATAGIHESPTVIHIHKHLRRPCRHHHRRCHPDVYTSAAVSMFHTSATLLGMSLSRPGSRSSDQ